MKAELKEGIL